MESNSEAGRIHCSEAAYKALNATSPDILCEKRTGLGPIKGKGKMKTYWVLGRAPMGARTCSRSLSDEEYLLLEAPI